MKRFLLFVYICGFAISVLGLQNDGIIAKVEEYPVTISDLKKRVAFLKSVREKRAESVSDTILFRYALDMLIDEAVTTLSAKRLEIVGDPSMVEERIKEMAEANGMKPEEYISDLKQKGVNIKDMQHVVFFDVLWEKICRVLLGFESVPSKFEVKNFNRNIGEYAHMTEKQIQQHLFYTKLIRSASHLRFTLKKQLHIEIYEDPLNAFLATLS